MPIERLRVHKEWLAIASLAVLAVVIWALVPRGHEAAFRAVFLDVGQGDCIFLQTPSGRTILVDGGGRSQISEDEVIGMRVVEPFLRREAVNRIDVVVLTHPHDDHLQGLLSVVRDFRVGMVLDSGIPHGSETYQRLLSLVKAKGIPYRRAVRGQVIDFGDGVRAEVLHPPSVRLAGTGDNANNNSIVLRFTCQGSALLLTGDAGMEAESDILASGVQLRSDVLKVAHHGSRGATSDRWLDAVQPRLAAISVGKSNPFGHPSREVLDRLSAHGTEVYRTDRDGAVILEITAGRQRMYGVLGTGVGTRQ